MTIRTMATSLAMLAVLTTNCMAQSSIVVKRKAYDLHGTTAAEIWLYSIQKGPKMGKESVVAMTSFVIKRNSCHDGIIQATELLPRWAEYGQASQTMQEVWDEYALAIRLHEDTHVRYAKEMLADLERVNCNPKLVKKIVAARELKDKALDASVQYNDRFYVIARTQLGDE